MFSCPDSDGEFVYLVITAVSVLICIPSQQVYSKLGAARARVCVYVCCAADTHL